jgi:hypothetical protein
MLATGFIQMIQRRVQKMIKYCCDDCGAELTEFDNVAGQLDTTGSVYCHTCYPKHEEERKPIVYDDKLYFKSYNVHPNICDECDPDNPSCNLCLGS